MRCRVLMASSSRGTTLSVSVPTTFTSAGSPTRASLSAPPSTSPSSPCNTWPDTPHLYESNTHTVPVPHLILFTVRYNIMQFFLYNCLYAAVSHTTLNEMELNWVRLQPSSTKSKLSVWKASVPAAADDLVVQVGGKAFQVHIVVHKHKLQLPWSTQI